MKDSFAKNVAVALLGLLVALVAIEAFFYAAPNFLPHNVRFVSTSVFDDELRQTFKPNIDTVQRLDDGIQWRLKTTDLHIGGVGFRDNGADLSDAYAVVVGDSHVYGHGVDLERVWTELLEERAGASVVNMGQPSAFPETEERMLETYGSRLKPKVVIFALFQNDWVDAASFEDERSGGFATVKRTLDSYSSTYRLARLVINMQRYQAYKNFPRYTNGSVDTYFYPLHLGPAVDDGDPKINMGEESAKNSMLRAAEFADSNGMKIVFVIFPSREQIYWDFARQYAPDPGFDINVLNEKTMETCAENGLSCLDLTQAFVRNRDSQIFFTIDGHPNEAGHAIASDEIYKHLSENGLLPR